MNALLKQISEAACADLEKLMEEGSEDILSAIHKAEEEAQLQETAPKFSLGFKITVDLDKSTFDCQLGWSFKQTLSVSHQIEDPAQVKLPLDEAKITIVHGLKSVQTTAKQMKEVTKKFSKN